MSALFLMRCRGLHGHGGQAEQWRCQTVPVRASPPDPLTWRRSLMLKLVRVQFYWHLLALSRGSGPSIGIGLALFPPVLL